MTAELVNVDNTTRKANAQGRPVIKKATQRKKKQ